jgi:hypothetical protein
MWRAVRNQRKPEKLQADPALHAGQLRNFKLYPARNWDNQ